MPISEPTPPAPPPTPLPILPPNPDIYKEKPVPPPPPIQALPIQPTPNFNIQNQYNNPFDNASEEKKKMLQERRKSSIMVMGSGKSSDTLDSKDKIVQASKDTAQLASQNPKSDFLGFGNGAFDQEQIQRSSAPQVVATRVPDLDKTVLQGKLIDAVLETAINTDIPGTLRAIVTRDVYSESGTNILIPKASRLVGSYEAQIKPGQTRVNITWNRLIRPDGIDIAINSIGTDQLGRAGVAANVDNKFINQMASAFLVSYLIPIGAQSVLGTDGQITTSATTGGDGKNPGTTTTGSAKDLALQKGTDEFTKVAGDAVKNTFSVTPTMTIDQGTIVKILAQRDLIFPAISTNRGVMIK